MITQVAPERRPKTAITNMDRLTSPAGRGYVPVNSPTRSANSKIVVMEIDGAGLRRVRMGRTSEVPGAIMGEDLRVVTTDYLDGHSHRVSSTGSYFQEDVLPFDAVPMKTSDVTDFGRLSMAAKALAQSMMKFGPQNEPSPEQLAVFVAGYRNLLEWRRKVHEQMTRAEGEIDVVEELLKQIL